VIKFRGLADAGAEKPDGDQPHKTRPRAGRGSKARQHASKAARDLRRSSDRNEPAVFIGFEYIGEGKVARYQLPVIEPAAGAPGCCKRPRYFIFKLCDALPYNRALRGAVWWAS